MAVSSSTVLQTLLNEPIKRNTWMTSDSEVLDISATKTANDASNATNQTQPTAAVHNSANDNDTTDGSVASIADQVDENIDEIIEEAIEVDTDSRSSQCRQMRVDSDESQRSQIEHQLQKTDIREKIM